MTSQPATSPWLAPHQVLGLPAVRFALWGNALLAGRTSPDSATDAIAAGSLHRVAGLPGVPDGVSLPIALGALRAAGTSAYEAVLPRPGDPGVTGDRAFVEGAVERGAVVLARGTDVALVPSLDPTDRAVVRWRAWSGTGPADEAAGVAAAGRELREAVLAAADDLAALDAPTAGVRLPPDIATYLALPSGMPPRAAELVVRALRLLVAVEAALGDPAVATSAGLDRHRRRSLEPVARAARRALHSATVAERVGT